MLEHTHLRIVFGSMLVLALCSLATATSGNVSFLGFPLPGLCTFRFVTGLDCPGCGLTRSLILALHGQFLLSYQMHIWGIPLLALLGLQIPYRLMLYYRRQELPARLPPSFKTWISHFVLLSLLLPWVAKTLAYLFVRYC